MKSTSLFLALGLVLFLAAAAPLRADPGLDQARADQERAQSLARDMLTNLLDSNLQQLRENLLTTTPLYQDLKTLRDRMNELANEDMADVVDLLTRSLSATGPERTELVGRAQARMRQILVRLLAEREKLRIRRKHAQLMDMISEVLQKQIDTRDQTQILTARDEQAALDVKGSQKTVNDTYASLSSALQEVSTWSGDLGAAAAAAAHMLSDQKVGPQLSAALDNLVALRFPQAVTAQNQVIASLQKVLAELRKLTAPASERAEALALIRQLLQQQQGLRDRIKPIPLTADVVDAFYKEQAGIQQKIQKLYALVPDSSRTTPLMTRADAAAGAAGQAIFNTDKPTTLDQQDRVIGALAQLEKEIQQQIAQDNKPKSADELAHEAHQLAQAREQVAQALDKEVQAQRTAPRETAQAAKLMTQARATLAQAAKTADIPATVRARIATAAQDAAHAAEHLQAGSQAKPEVKQAQDSARLALGETNDAQAKDNRDAMAVRLGELNRAAEALSRAAAAARMAAGNVQKGPKGTQPAKGLLQQADDVARHIDQGVKEAVPATNAPLAQAIAAGDKAQAQMPQAAQPRGVEARQAAASHSQAMARNLDQAAQAIRQAMVDTAKKLDSTATAEMAQVDQLKNQVDQARQQNDSGKATPPALQQLADQATPQAPDVGAAVRDAAQAAHNPPVTQPAASNPPGHPIEPPAGQNQPTGANAVNQELSRAQTLAEVRHDNLEGYKRLAQEMAAAAQAQMQASDQIAQGRQDLAKQDNQSPQNQAQQQAQDQQKPNPAAQQLAQAMNDFAEAATTLGESVQKATGQSEIANQPIRQGVEAANAIPTPPPQGQEQPQGQGEDQQQAQGQPQQPQGQEQAQGRDQQQQGQGRQQAQGQQGRSPQSGAGMKPEDALGTAMAMAGPQAAQAAMKAMGQGQQPGQAGQQPGQQANQGKGGDQVSTGLVRGQTSRQVNAGGQRGGDTAVTDAQPAPQVWSTQFPPAVRQAMRATEKQTPPPGYEERLRQYFESGN